MSDLSGPPSPSDSSSGAGSPLSEGRVEPMGLTDFIGALTKEPKSEKPKSKKDRSDSVTQENEIFNKEKATSRLLDKDFDYQKYVHAEDFGPASADAMQAGGQADGQSQADHLAGEQPSGVPGNGHSTTSSSAA